MPLISLADLNTAYDEGRWHLQHVLKNAGTAHALQWADPTFASGQPAYDAHVGAALAFTPCIAQKNDAIYFPPVAAGQHRHLVGLTLRANQATYSGPASVVLFDLLGYYPLIDGDSTDEQAMDNSLTLPRYSDGEGVGLVIVNHVAPALQQGTAVINYTNSDGVAQSLTLALPNAGQNLVCSGHNAVSANSAAITIPLANGARGIRSLDSITYATPPGGLHCAYLVKILGSAVLGDNLVAMEKDFALHNAFACPRIHDGAWLGFFDRIGSGTARSVSWFGHFTFAWG